MRLIDADLLEKIFVKAHCFDCAEGNQKKFNACRNSEIKPLCESFSFKYLIDSLPTIDAVEVKHGEWIHGREIGKEWNCGYWITYFEDWHCSNCGIVFEQESKPKYHFCPNCGAKMDGERRDPCS